MITGCEWWREEKEKTRREEKRRGGRGKRRKGIDKISFLSDIFVGEFSALSKIQSVQ